MTGGGNERVGGTTFGQSETSSFTPFLSLGKNPFLPCGFGLLTQTEWGTREPKACQVWAVGQDFQPSPSGYNEKEQQKRKYVRSDGSRKERQRGKRPLGRRTGGLDLARVGAEPRESEEQPLPLWPPSAQSLREAGRGMEELAGAGFTTRPQGAMKPLRASLTFPGGRGGEWDFE